MPVITCIYCL